MRTIRFTCRVLYPAAGMLVMALESALQTADPARKMEHSGSHQPPQKDAQVKAVVSHEWPTSQSERMMKLHL